MVGGGSRPLLAVGINLAIPMRPAQLSRSWFRILINVVSHRCTIHALAPAPMGPTIHFKNVSGLTILNCKMRGWVLLVCILRGKQILPHFSHQRATVLVILRTNG